MNNKKILFLLSIPILNLLLLIIFLKINEIIIIVTISFALFYIFFSIKISKKYKNKGLNTLFILSYLAILFFPTFHFISYKINESNYYLSDYLKDSANHRLEEEKYDNEYNIINFEIIKNSLSNESDSTLNKSEFYKLKKLNYLDSIGLYGLKFKPISDSTYNYSRYSRHGGGGFKQPTVYLTVFKNERKININYFKNNTIRKTFQSYLNGYNSFYDRFNDVKKEIGFVDFWFASISSFKFSEIIPNSYLTKSLWIFQSIISFILLFYISTNIPQLEINKKSKDK